MAIRYRVRNTCFNRSSFLYDPLSRFLDACHLASELLFTPAVELAATQFASLLNVPRHFLIHLFTIEDKRFTIHPGVDPAAIVRAALADLINRDIEGASTITQQLYDVNRERLGVARKRTFGRKIRQAIWALLEDARKSKLDILSEYLRLVYWGRSYYGLDAATRAYFGASRDAITLSQSFFLAERLATPNLALPSRVVALLERRSISFLFSEEPSSLEELISIYDRHFQCGGEIWECLAKSHKRLAAPMSKFSLDASK